MTKEVEGETVILDRLFSFVKMSNPALEHVSNFSLVDNQSTVERSVNYLHKKQSLRNTMPPKKKETCVIANVFADFLGSVLFFLYQYSLFA